MVKVVFLDRDGTINVDTGEVYLIEQWEFTPRAVTALRMMQDAGYALAIVTNQRKIAEGICTEEQLWELHRWMSHYLNEQGVYIAAGAYCPHSIEANCDCRKPKTGMAKQIEKYLSPIDYANSWMIGDKPTDMAFGKGIGVHTILIRSRFAETDHNADFCAENLYEAAQIIAE